jgi:hypothetical protein
VNHRRGPTPEPDVSGDYRGVPEMYPRGMVKRGYSREFTPKTERRVQIVIDRVPPTLKDAVDAKAKREGISVRALVLTLLKDWLAR